MVLSLLIIDSRVAGWQQLVASLDSSTQWELIDAGVDGLDRLAQVAGNYKDLSSIQIVSHGAPGSFKLGSTEVTLEALNSHAASLASIGQALSADGDLLLYGCNTGQGVDGLQFMTTLAQLTGADVAASINATGSSSLGGDSVLEAAVGTVATDTVLPSRTIGGLPQLLGNTTSTIPVNAGSWQLFDPNNTVIRSGTISSSTQIDTYRFMPDVSGLYTISAGGASIDAKMRLYNVSGNTSSETPNGEIDLAVAGRTESITVNLIAAQWYYVAVTGFGIGTGSTGNYTLNVSGPPITPATITVGGTANTGSASRTLDYGGDNDFFRFVAPAGATRLTAQVNPASGLDTDPALYDIAGVLLTAFDTGFAGNFDNLTNWSIVAGRTYFIGVTGISTTSTGSYSVAVDFDPDTIAANRAPVLVSPLPDLTLQEGTSFTRRPSRSTFSDQEGATLTFSASLANGSPLPLWLSFVPTPNDSTFGGTFSGTPPAFGPDLSVRLVATDPGGLSASQTFTIFTPDVKVVTGTNGNDTLIGVSGETEIFDALGGNDRIIIGGDRVGDIVSGGDGFDTVVFTFDKGDYLISKVPSSGDYGVIFKTGVGSFIGSDVERLEFRDGTVDPSTSKYFGGVQQELPGSVASVFRFFNNDTQAFFYSSSVAEKNTVLANSDVSRNNVNEWAFVYQGSTFEAAHTFGGAVQVQRFFRTDTNSHFFTSSAAEAANVKANIASGIWPFFVFEGSAFNVYASDPTPNSVGSEIPVQRFFSNELGKHWFTADSTEIAQIRLTGLWVDEGIGFWGEKPGP